MTPEKINEAPAGCLSSPLVQRPAADHPWRRPWKRKRPSGKKDYSKPENAAWVKAHGYA